MNFLLVALLLMSCGTWLAKSEQFHPYSRACTNFEQSQEFPIPRCQANFWFYTCLYRYTCNEMGDMEFSDCRKWDSHCEYPDCKDLFCASSREDMKENMQRLEETTSESTTLPMEMLELLDRPPLAID